MPRTARSVLHVIARFATPLLVLGACRGERAARPVAASIACVAERSTASVRCLSGAGATSPVTDRTETALLLTGQDDDISIVASDVVWADTTVSFTLAMRSLVGQRIGVDTNGTPDPRGIRLVFVTPVDTGEGGPLATPVPDPPLIQDSSLASRQLALRFRTTLDSGAVSAEMPVRLRVAAGTRTAQFALMAVAPVQFPHGWLRITPEAAGVTVGKSTALRAVQRNAAGRSAVPVAIRWSLIGAGGVASISRNGSLRGLQVGDARAASAA